MNEACKNLKKVNNGLFDLSKTYHVAIPLNDAFDLLESHGFTPVQEDGTPWSGIFCGREGRAVIDLTYGGILSRKCLVISWYKMDVSGKYEVTAYVS